MTDDKQREEVAAAHQRVIRGSEAQSAIVSLKEHVEAMRIEIHTKFRDSEPDDSKTHMVCNVQLGLLSKLEKRLIRAVNDGNRAQEKLNKLPSINEGED